MFRPIFLIGAARSGTKLLRDLIAGHPQIDRVPFDVNYVWRMGNESLPHDELLPEMAGPAVRRRIQRHLEKSRQGGDYLIEKTVSNSLRVPFVEAIFPGAKYIHLTRDGLDVAESAFRQWQAPPDWRYIVAKLRNFPLAGAFGYGLSYAGKLIKRIQPGSGKRSPAAWGPLYRGIYRDIETHSLIEVCALQWHWSVAKASGDLSRLPSGRVFSLAYEQLVAEPDTWLDRIFAFIDPSLDSPPAGLCREVNRKSVGKGLRDLSPEQAAQVQEIFEKVGRVNG